MSITLASKGLIADFTVELHDAVQQEESDLVIFAKENITNTDEDPMDENDGNDDNKTNSYRLQNTTGVVSVPRGSKGPRSLYLKRHGDSFGFTLRHFIVYPPDSIAEQCDGRHAAVGALLAPMDTIFVKNVKDHSPAQYAGLQKGDRLIAVNGVPVNDKSYSQVVQLIVNSPDYLHLLVVPKEEDVLQKFFSETAYNPASNQQIYPDHPCDKQTAQKILTDRLTRGVTEFQIDAISWRSLQQPYSQSDFAPLRKVSYEKGQHSAENILYSTPRQRQNQIYAEIQPHDITYRRSSRAAPQVPLYKKMGRRASEGNGLLEYEASDYSSVNVGDSDDVNMKAVHKSSYLPENVDMSSLNYPNSTGYGLNFNVGRRESTSSLSSSIADSSKDSLVSYDSMSTLTGHETDDSAIMTRFRKSVKQKEEFLKMPASTVERALIRREFYSRPKRLEPQVWPPSEREISSRVMKPIHLNFQRVKSDIENERDLSFQNQADQSVEGGSASYAFPKQSIATSPKEKVNMEQTKVHEAEVAPEGYSNVDIINGTILEENTYSDKRYSPGLQIVQKRAKDFESGKPLPEDDPVPLNRMNFSRSELARLSSKKLVPNVSERAHEYETRVEPRRDPSSTSTSSGQSVLTRIQRDSRSLDSSGSNASATSIQEILKGTGGKRLSGNVTISSGSKYLHCPPPPEWQKGEQKNTETLGNSVSKVRVRSNSVDSWVGALEGDNETARITSRNDATKDRNVKRESEADMDTNSLLSQYPRYADLPPLIPESVEHIQVPPVVSITPAPTPIPKAIRPNQLDLDGPVRPARHLKAPSLNTEMPDGQKLSPNMTMDDKPVVVKRRPKISNISEDDRTVRRESYLKATEAGRVHFDSDHSDTGDISPQALRGAHRRWRPPLFPGDIQQLRKLFEDAASSMGDSWSSSSVSLEKEKGSGSSSLSEKLGCIIREGNLHCKILEIDGKRSGDRSWKQVLAVLKGPKLFLYKDNKQHPSPIGNSDTLDSSLAAGVDMRTSVVRVAEDYTKRKNVLRVSAVQPCRSEFLLQADTTEEFADWVKTLQEQVAASTDAELAPANCSQQAVPQLVPASTSIQVQGSHLSPQVNKNKATTSRNRSPTGQSPVSKSRKPSQVLEQASTSPKSKTWRGRMVRQFKKFNQGASSPNSPTAPEGSTFGIPIEECLPSSSNIYVPRFVEICTDIIDERGLQTVGIYRVPGNNASITVLTEEINRNYDDVPVEDARWNDLHVVSSLFKSFFRKMPDSLITAQLYPNFIKADKIENPKVRMEELKKLIKSLPKHNYYTLKHIIYHLKRVADNCATNKMEAKNLAIVFGPTIVRTEGENMECIVTDMTNQCKIVETLLLHADWFFLDYENEENMPVPVLLPDECDEFETNTNQALLLHNISKYEALKDTKEKNGALFSSIISAAQRKVKRKPNKPSSSLSECKDEPVSPTNLKVFPTQSFSTSDIKESSASDSKSTEPIPTTVTEIEKKNKSVEKVPWFNYSTDKDAFYRRIQNFKQETEAMLQLPRKTEISINNIDSRSIEQFSSSSGNVNQNTRLSAVQFKDPHTLTKTHSASNVYSRTRNLESARNSLNSDSGPFSLQFVSDKSDSLGYEKMSDCRDQQKSAGYSDVTDSVSSDKRTPKFSIRRSGSVENVNTNSATSSGHLKKVKYENESHCQRTGSLDSLNKLSNDDDSLLSTMTKLIDEKLKEEHSLPLVIASEDIPFVDDSPEKLPPTKKMTFEEKENIPQSSDLYRNPSLHKNQYSLSKTNKKEYKEHEKETEKEEDTMATKSIPDNDKHFNRTLSLTANKLKRSESLNKPDKSTFSFNKVKRSESLNKAEHKLKRSDSLTKSEKTESNINKRRELSITNKKIKDCSKNKRKNGMPDRSIKRRHTVGGTKDLENIKDTNKRTSSPDLSSAGRENIFFEINLICPENMIVALKKHLIGTRPQSFPESTVYKVPLESHV